MKKVIITLTVTVLLATAAIGISHYYSLKILSAARAYINFESQYSKSEKDACRHIMSYVYSHDETDYLLFKNDITIPQGDRMAREALMAGKEVHIARVGFLLGGNRREDLPEMIQFFRDFKEKTFFKNAINKWAQADALVSQLNAIGTGVHKQIDSGKRIKDRQGLVLRINTISDNLTIQQQDFSDLLGSTSRLVNHYVFIADLMVAIIIIGCSALMAGLMLRKLHTSKKLMASQYLALKSSNERMDKFVFTLTHDLRSPITSLTGLVAVLENEKDINNIPTYTAMMKESLEGQDKFIKEVLNAIKHENKQADEICNIGEVVNDVISQNSFSANGKQVKFVNELNVSELKCNTTNLRVMFNNLISNAIKYSDFKKPEQWIKIRSSLSGNCCVIEIEDNGLGIKPEQSSNIFKKFFKAGRNKKSTGLGLYFTKQAIEDMNGTITVKSLLGIGTSFIVSLPV